MADISADPEAILRLLRDARRIAVVGCSPRPDRDSHRIARYLISNGYDVIPVHPGHEELLGRRCFPTVAAIPGPVEIVDIFRRREYVPEAVEDAIAAHARAVWMQLDTGNAAAAERAARAGLDVVVERCIMVDHRALNVPRR